MLINDFIEIDKAGYPASIKWTNVMKVPEFAALEHCEQNPVWHKEGNALQHTKNVVAAMHKLIQEFDCRTHHNLMELMVDAEEARILMAAALFHDIGKAVTTEFKKGAWHSYGHEIESEKITRSVLWDEKFDIREAVCALVGLHMEPLNLTRSNFKKLTMKMDRRLAEGHYSYSPVSINHLFLLKIADTMGSDMTDTDRKNLDIQFLLECHHNISRAQMIKEEHLDKVLADYDLRKAPHQKKKRKYGIILIGLPGAGKNYCVENQLKYVLSSRDINGSSFITVSRDDIRAELGYCKPGEKIIGTPEQENTVTERYYEKLDVNMELYDAIVFNDMNIKAKYRNNYREYVEKNKKYDWKWIYIYIEASSLNVNINRRAGQIHERHFTEFTRVLDWPKPDEYDELIILKQE